MRSRDSKGRFIRKVNSEKSEKKSNGTASPTVSLTRKYKDSKGRWHGSNGKYV